VQRIAPSKAGALLEYRESVPAAIQRSILSGSYRAVVLQKPITANRAWFKETKRKIEVLQELWQAASG
jgi:hypothetical protein